MERVYISSGAKMDLEQYKGYIKALGFNQTGFISACIKYCIDHKIDFKNDQYQQNISEQLDDIRREMRGYFTKEIEEQSKLRNQIFGFLKTQEKEYIIKISKALGLILQHNQQEKETLMAISESLLSLHNRSKATWKHTIMTLEQLDVDEDLIQKLMETRD